MQPLGSNRPVPPPLAYASGSVTFCKRGLMSVTVLATKTGGVLRSQPLTIYPVSGTHEIV